MTYNNVSHYQDDTVLAAQLNALTQSIWGITVLDGAPSDYVPFSMQTENEIVANVCVGQFDVVVNGNALPASMIQTVLTHESHRRQGLIRALFASVQAHVANTTGRTFFTADQDKIDFYQQFGYQHRPIIDYFRWQKTPTSVDHNALTTVNLLNEQERLQFEDTARHRTPVSDVFGFENKPWLMLWFVRHFLSANLYYWEARKVYLILRIDDGRLDLLDIVGQRIPDWSELLSVLPMVEATEVRSYFVPDKLHVQADPVYSETDRFFFDAAFPLPELICLPETQRG